jgi:hypothetical protein
MKRFRIIGITIAAILAAGLVVFWFLHREPRYQGRTMTQWLQINHDVMYGVLSGPETSRLRFKAGGAINAIGTNGIPVLLNLLRAKDSPFKVRMRVLFFHQRFIKVGYPSDQDKHNLAKEGFGLLDQKARPAIPDLARLCDDPDEGVRFIALNVLLNLQPDKQVLVPVLLKRINDTHPGLKKYSIDLLNQTDPEAAEKAGVRKKITRLKWQNTFVKVDPQTCENANRHI